MTGLFGERGQHARTAIGVRGLPAGAAVEVDMIVELHPEGLSVLRWDSV